MPATCFRWIRGAGSAFCPPQTISPSADRGLSRHLAEFWMKKEKRITKLHFACGTRSHIITAAVVTHRDIEDLSQLAELLDTLRRRSCNPRSPRRQGLHDGR